MNRSSQFLVALFAILAIAGLGYGISKHLASGNAPGTPGNAALEAENKQLKATVTELTDKNHALNRQLRATNPQGTTASQQPAVPAVPAIADKELRTQVDSLSKALGFDPEKSEAFQMAIEAMRLHGDDPETAFAAGPLGLPDPGPPPEPPADGNVE